MAGPSEGGGAQSSINGAMLASMKNHGSDHSAEHGSHHAAAMHTEDSIGIGGQMEPFNMSESISPLGKVGAEGFDVLLASLNRDAALSKKPNELGPAVEPVGLNGSGITNKDMQGMGNIALEGATLGKGLNVPAGVPGPVSHQQGHG
jgi:hypothetical protein